MAVTSLQSNNNRKTLLQRFRKEYPDILFVPSDNTYWDSEKKTIFYQLSSENFLWSVLHELGHAQQQHSTYKNDLQLLIMEKEAWSAAKELGNKFQVKFDENYVEDCLDSYRDWLHRRSLCPVCNQTGIQNDSLQYICLNCKSKWEVSISRFCRSYRRTI